MALVLLARAIISERTRRRNLQSDLELTSRSLDQAETRVPQQEANRLDAVAEGRRPASGLRDRLGATGR